MNQTQVIEPPATHQLVLRPAGGADAASLSEMLLGLPEWSLYMRFQTAIGSPPRPELLQQMLEPNGAAWVAERDGRVIGHSMWAWVAGVEVPTVELAVIVAEAEQRRGLGVQLMTESGRHALAAGAGQFLVMVSAMNDKVLRMVRRRWPSARVERDGALLNFTVPAADFFTG
ncbi:GNAT family N-acetyltransferase [Kribbella sp. NPDC056861]|uniref:GNAT family N-acetyltransferase n=1 Tax=Kribbella sp. NPDC056861 TaxID=3154857 RepID=UPI00342D9DC6